MKTVVHNRTDILFKIEYHQKLCTLRPGENYYLWCLDPNIAKYKEYWFEGDTENGFGGERGRKYYVTVSSDDLYVWRSIELVPRGHDATEFEWKGITPRTLSPGRLPGLRIAWKNASRKMDAVARFSEELEKDLKRVVIYRAQCAHLVRFCSERVSKLRTTFFLLSGYQYLAWLYRWGNFKKFANHHLNDLLRALMSAQKLLKGCDQKEWRRAALVLSLPPPDPQNLEKYSESKFAHVIRELGWSFDLVQYALVIDDTPDFKWDDGRDRYVFQGNQPEDGVADDEMELLEGDRDREILDHKELLSDLEDGSLLKDSFSISLAGLIWYNFLIALAGWCWYDFFISLAGWLWYSFPLWNFAATICLAGCSWYNSSHVKFAATIQNRCRKQTIQNWCLKEHFDIDYSDLRKKKFIGKGGFKKVHKGKWLGLEVAIATFVLEGNTSEGIDCEDVEKEARFMVTLHHPNVVEFYGCAIQKDQSTFLVMEFMKEDLGGVIGRIMKYQGRRFGGLFSLYPTRQSEFGGPFSLSVTVDILMQIVEAMIHSHKHEVMHRDLKPANCLVSRKAATRFDVDAYYRVKVIDFGISKSWSTETDKNTARRGTDHYMAPEVRAKPGQDTCTYTWSADVYSFGMLCFEVITGLKPLTSPPFNRCRTAKARYKLLSEGDRPNIPPNCPGRLEALIKKCWAADPRDRPTFIAIRRDLWDLKHYIGTC